MQESLVLKNKDVKSLVRALCKKSLYYFILHFWDTIATNDFIDNWHIKAICDEIQPEVLKALKGEKKKGDIIINICPGTTKSTIISQMLPAWCWSVYPKSVIISSTGTAQLTTKNAMKSRDIIQSKKYKILFPEVVIRKDASAKTFYQNTKNGTRYAFTTKGNPIGNHAHLILIDDPESQKDARNQTMMEYSKESIKALSTRMVDKESTLRILLMQRLTENDSTSIALEKFTNPKHICLPAVLSDKVKPVKFKKKYVNGLLDPIRLSKEILKEEKKKLNDFENETSELDYDAQFLQDPSNPEGLLYTPFKYFDLDSIDLSQGQNYAFIDPANGGGDYLCCWVICLLNNKAYVIDALYTKQSSTFTFPLLEDLFKRHKTVLNFFELNNHGDLFAKHFKKKGFSTGGFNQGANKTSRIITSTHYATYLNFANPSSVKASKDYKQALNDLVRFPKNCISINDDAPDCLQLSIFYFNNKHPYIFQDR